MKNNEQITKIMGQAIFSQVESSLPSGEARIRITPIDHVLLNAHIYRRGKVSSMEEYEFVGSTGGKYRRLYCNGRHKTHDEHHVSTVFIGGKMVIQHIAEKEKGEIQRFEGSIHISQSGGDIWLREKEVAMKGIDDLYFLVRKTSFVPREIKRIKLFGQKALLRLYKDVVHSEGGYSALIVSNDGGRTSLVDNEGNTLGKGVLISNSPRIHRNDERKWVDVVSRHKLK